jgi:hypothetical protein
LPRDLIDFLRDYVPSYEAAVFLVLAAKEPDRAWTAKEMAERLGGEAGSADLVRSFVEHFERKGLVRSNPDGSFRFIAENDALGKSVDDLRAAYERRPVTLVRVMGALDAKLRSFSDSFKLKRD